VTGVAGTILHTEDGGESWTAQLGGDPQSQERELCCLQYCARPMAERGKRWPTTRFGSISRFLSVTKGVNAYGNTISLTGDGGRTWNKVDTCHAGMDVDGLTRDVSCTLGVVNFPSSNVGYAAHEARVIVKTEDGGATWNAMAGPQEPGDQRVYGLAFLDERTGFAVRSGAKLYRTEDGGQTWHGLVASPGNKILFSGPNVDWSFRGKAMVYTTDGGRRWTSREIGFPVPVNSFCLPTTQRGYVVGDHGMIYRYRIVPVEYTAKGMLAAPGMGPQ
jgi:photosystem II stability/assembly factor-like uncharacterized protein